MFGQDQSLNKIKVAYFSLELLFSQISVENRCDKLECFFRWLREISLR